MSRTLTLVTWNINSVRLRLPIVEQLIAERAPDVVCLQETKCPDGNFPSAAFKKLGYEHIALNGQKGYHGVATLSRIPFAATEMRAFCGKEDSRHVAVRLALGSDEVRIHNFYVPAGGDEPDPAINDKFAHKLSFLAELEQWIGSGPAAEPTIVVGDLNIAPLPDDVWSHKKLIDVVSHTPIETETLERIRLGGQWHDVMRQFVPVPEKLYTWWSYRAADWSAADKGRRLDHVWASPGLADRFRSMTALRDARGWDRPSDHVPVVVTLDL
ncbi:MAG: exodeoxyribonuclease III [Ancalomicrobiaceae bacterium]|nr:exodeoxyribonuclease III [Ancalomicrobiaceae bacterium]